MAVFLFKKRRLKHQISGVIEILFVLDILLVGFTRVFLTAGF